MPEDQKIILETMKQGFDAVNHTVTQRFNEIEENFNKRFNNLEGRFDTLEGRFDKLEFRVDTQDDRLGKFEDRFDRLEIRHDKLDDHLKTLTVTLTKAATDIDWIKRIGLGIGGTILLYILKQVFFSG